MLKPHVYIHPAVALCLKLDDLFHIGDPKNFASVQLSEVLVREPQSDVDLIGIYQLDANCPKDWRPYIQFQDFRLREFKIASKSIVDGIEVNSVYRKDQ